MPKKKTPEGEVLSSCLEFLKGKGACVIRNNTGAIPVGKRLIRFGSPGSADLIFAFRGFACACECKRPKGKATEAQKKWLEAWAAAGGRFVVATSLDDLMKFIHELELEIPS